MKQYIIAIILVLQASLTFAQQEKKFIKQGNELYQQKKYKEAEAAYRQATGKQAKTLEGNFNLADAMFKQKKYGDASNLFNKIANGTSDKNAKAGAFHNVGNSFLTEKKYQESIDAYKKALLNNPKDDETRYNLAYAQKMLKNQQDKNKGGGGGGGGKDKNKDKNKDDKNKDKSDKDKKDQDKKDQDKNKQDQNKQNQDQKDQQQQQGQQPNQLSKNDAQNMLDALNNDEKQTQEKLKNKKLKGAKVPISKDW
jgi:tetratricopeptide (TPR) repeat protein